MSVNGLYRRCRLALLPEARFILGSCTVVELYAYRYVLGIRAVLSLPIGILVYFGGTPSRAEPGRAEPSRAETAGESEIDRRRLEPVTAAANRIRSAGLYGWSY